LASAISYEPGITWTVDNETYGISVPMSFDNWTLGAHWIRFNGLGFNITSTNPIYLNFSYFNNQPRTTIPGETVYTYTMTCAAGTTWFNISGLKPSYQYKYKLDGGDYTNINTDATGLLSYSYNAWSTHTYGLYDRLPSTPVEYNNEATDSIMNIAIPAILAITLIVVLLAILYAGALTIETFVTWLILFFIAMIAIFTIFGISI
jgi:hypothetical protein